MRMKKIILIAAVAIAAAACSKTFDTNLATEKAIGFGTWAENLTKAEARVQGSSTFLAGDTFKVSGTKENSGTKTVFNGVTVEAKAGSPLVWEYSPLRFWDSHATSYTFYAVSPAAAATVATDGKVASTSAVEFTGKVNDILVATEKVVPNADFNKKVELVFNHAASLVDIKVKKANVLKDATVTVSALTLKNIQSKGNLAVDTYTSNLPDVAWTHDGTSYKNYVPADGVEVVDITSPIVIANDANFTPDYGNTPATSTDLIKKLVVMPQTFATTGDKKQQLEVTYKIQISADDVIEHTATVDLANFDDRDDTDQNDNKIAGWDNGKHYIFYITLDANAIEFTAKITDWTTTSVSGYHYIIN